MDAEVGPTTFLATDLPRFLALATAEGWVCDPWEFAWLLAAFPAGCLVVRCGMEAVGFVTAVRHGESGWLGNLLVAPGWRGRGLGRQLFVAAWQALQVAGCRTVWLTASAEGRPLYAGLGFHAIDRVRRWVGSGTGGEAAAAATVAPLPPALLDIDRQGWGDDRGAMLAAVAARSRLLASRDGFVLLQPCGADLQFGPWGATTPAPAGQLLQRAQRLAAAGQRLVVDLPKGNRHGEPLLASHGFICRGETTLMWQGEVPRYRPEFIYALASMGSFG